MTTKGHVKEIKRASEGFDVIFQVKDIGDLESIKDKELEIKAEVKRQRRGLNANAYFHLLVGRLAEVLNTSQSYMKNFLLARYGQPEMINGEYVFYKCNVPPEIMLEYEFIHASLVKVTDAYIYKITRGSSTYSTKEMSLLIDGTVSECKEVGIETLPPEELKRLLSLWKGK